MTKRPYTPEQLARRAAYDKAWNARNRDKRLAYWKQRSQNLTPEQLAKRRARQRRYYEAHREAYRAARRKWDRDNRVEIKVHRVLGITIKEARQLLEART